MSPQKYFQTKSKIVGLYSLPLFIELVSNTFVLESWKTTWFIRRKGRELLHNLFNFPDHKIFLLLPNSFLLDFLRENKESMLIIYFAYYPRHIIYRSSASFPLACRWKFGFPPQFSPYWVFQNKVPPSGGFHHFWPN